VIPVDDLELQLKGLVLVRALLEVRGASAHVIDSHTREIVRIRARLAEMRSEMKAAARTAPPPDVARRSAERGAGDLCGGRVGEAREAGPPRHAGDAELLQLMRLRQTGHDEHVDRAVHAAGKLGDGLDRAGNRIDAVGAGS
jgi:hypothetical protein